MPSSPAQCGHRRVAVRHRGLGQPHLGFRQRELPAALASAGPCGLEPGHGAFADQLPLELGQRREDAEHEPAGRGSNTRRPDGGGIEHVLVGRPTALSRAVQDLSARGVGLRVLAGQGAQIGHHDQMSQIAAEAVELPDHEHVALPQDPQAAVETRPVVAEAGGEVVVEVDRVVDARRPQGVALQVQRPAATRGGPAGPAVADRLREEAPRAQRTWSAGSSRPAGVREPSCRPRRRSSGSAPTRWSTRNAGSEARIARAGSSLARKAATRGGYPLSVGSRPLPQTTRNGPLAATPSGLSSSSSSSASNSSEVANG